MEDYYKEEIESIHKYLDDKEVPRLGEKGKLSIVGRIKQLEKKYIKEACDLETKYLAEIDNLTKDDTSKSNNI